MQWTGNFTTVLAVYHRGAVHTAELPLSSPLPSQAQTQAAQPRVATAKPHTHPLGLVAVWRDTLAVFLARGGPVLECALIGFALPIFVGTALWLGLRAPSTAGRIELAAMRQYLGTYVNTSGAFATYDALSRALNAPGGQLHAMLLFQAAIGCMGFAFARGAIIWLALNARGPAVSLSALSRAIVPAFPALLTGALAYGGVVAVGHVGLDVLLRALHFDLSNTGQRAATLEGVMGVAALRSGLVLIPQPNSPYAEFTPQWRIAVSADMVKAEHYAQRLKASGSQASPPALIARDPATFSAYSADRPQFWLLALGGVALLLVAEATLRFHAVMVFDPRVRQGRARTRLVQPLIECIRFGLRHTSSIAVHVCCLRLMVCAASTTFVVLPMTLSETFLTSPVLRAHLGTDTDHLQLMAQLGTWLTLALVNAVLTAFTAVYDARLAMRLDPRVSESAYSCSIR